MGGTPDQFAPRHSSGGALLAAAGSDRVLFAYDSAELNDAARRTLAAHARWFAANPGALATIEGHADERGTREYNLALGERRALAARMFLEGQGVPASRLQVISYGKERPAAVGTDEASMAENRRAVTVVRR